jgi:glycosyltransferase involved in cell wall biosynthesis
MSTPYAYPFSHYGGAEKYVYCLGKHLVRLGCEVKIMLAKTQKSDAVQYYDGIKYEFISFPIPQYQKRAWLFYYLFALKLARKLARERFDILHAFHITPYFYLGYKGRRPVVVEPFGLGSLCEAKSGLVGGVFKKLLLERPLRRCMKGADAVASEGDIQAGELAQFFGVSRDRIFNLPDGVELEQIEGYIGRSRLSRADVGIADADLVLINVNRLDRNKGVSYLVDALCIIDNRINTKLILVGAGVEERRIKQRISDLGLADKVYHYKDLSDEAMFQLYGLADISVTPTLWEGLPLVMLEAMAAGKPVVATKVSDIPNVVNGNGIVVPPANAEAIAEAILGIYNSGKMRVMGRKSLEIARNYDWSKTAEKALSKYQELTS